MKYYYETWPAKEFEIIPKNGLTFPTHLHSQAELIYITEGMSDAFVDGKCFSISDGDLILIMPNQLHSYLDRQPVKAKMIIIDVSTIPEFQDIFTKIELITPVIKSSVLCKKHFSQIIDALFRDYKTENSNVIKGYMYVIFGKLCSIYEMTPIKHERDTISQRIFNYCQENFTSSITLESTANELHISKSHLSHLFAQKFNINFRNYINSLRINKACILLQNGETEITKIAYETGYQTIRTFNRAFFKITGTTPKQYKRSFNS